MGLILGSRSKLTGGWRKPSPQKSEVQFFEMNSMVKAPSSGKIPLAVFGAGGGGLAADSWLVLGLPRGGGGVLFVEHFLTKSAFRLSTPSALLASILSRAWLTMKARVTGGLSCFGWPSL